MKRVNAVSIVIFVVLLASFLPAMVQEKPTKGTTNPVVALETSMGIIKVQLFPAKAPITVKNFLTYVNMGFYNGTIVHRVDFVVGMGGYTEALAAKPTLAGIKNESKNGLKNLRGTVAMARYDNPDSATSQFFINLKDNSHLDPSGNQYGYAVFGKVVEGMDVVDNIAKVKTGNKGPFYNIPFQTILVKSAKAVTQ
jgi:cyclophilin family peptidyl-prolyl cis-trans isomerase